MIILIKQSFRRMASDPISFSLLLIGFIVSLLMISIGTSLFAELSHEQAIKENGQPPNAISAIVNFDKQLDFELALKGASKDTGFIFGGNMIRFDSMSYDSYYPAYIEWFKSNTNWSYRISEGRYYTVDEMKNGNPVILIGKNLMKYATNISGKNYVWIFGIKYNVIGILGVKDQKTTLDSKILIPAKSISKKMKDVFFNNAFSFIIYNRNNSAEYEINKIITGAKRNHQNAVLVGTQALNNGDLSDTFSRLTFDLLPLIIYTYLVSIIFATNIMYFWLTKRRYEIGIRKAFGYSNKKIMKMLFSEVITICILSSVITFIILFFLNLFINEINGFTLKLYYENFIVATIVILFTSIITVILPTIKSISIQPIEAMKM